MRKAVDIKSVPRLLLVCDQKDEDGRWFFAANFHVPPA
jgi:hypothetical protein